MDLRLAGKHALVTGSSGGIGEGVAKIMAREGVAVVVHGRSEASTARVVKEILDTGGKAFAATGDLSSDQGASRVADRAFGALGAVDILVNNAGVFPFRGWTDTTPEDWSQIYNINVVSMVRLVRLLTPQMKQLGWGRIIQIASGVATSPNASMPDYAATKAATVNLTVSLARELAGTGITVNTVTPGAIVTPGWKDLALALATAQGWSADVNEIERRLLAGPLANPAGRLGRIEDVANVVAFLASPLADYVNGANFRVDGGLTHAIN
jgi:3-oxoacyl-[acyl-carrier protein] reductase